MNIDMQELSSSQQELMRAVLRVIVRGGVDQVRYRSVAEEAGVSLGTVSYHYRNREELIVAALKYYLAENLRQLFLIKDQFKTRNFEDVANYLVAICKKDFKDKNKLVIAEYELLVFAARNEEVAEAVEAHENIGIAELAKALEQAGIEKPFMMAQTLAELIRGFQLTNLGNKKIEYKNLYMRILTLLEAARAGE